MKILEKNNNTTSLTGCFILFLCILFGIEFIHDDYLVYYRFLGRVMGKALFDRQLVAGHMAHFIYKHMLGWPIAFKDIASIDEEYYNNLNQMHELAINGEDLSMLCLDFSTTQEIMGVKETIDLIPNGCNIEVDNDNFPEYLEACFKYRMLDRIMPQLKELLLDMTFWKFNLLQKISGLIQL